MLGMFLRQCNLAPRGKYCNANSRVTDDVTLCFQ